MKILLQTLAILSSLLLAGCATDLPVKTVRGTPPPNESDKAPENEEAPAAEVPAPAPEAPATSAAPTSTTEHREDIKLSNLEMQKFAYELGLDPKKPSAKTTKKRSLSASTFANLSALLILKKNANNTQKFCRGSKTTKKK
jgi:pyruvate/2-oxoglutarate dehydrogenase complex dihydrolipoamide acyltransferase (E2) component